MWYLAGFDCRGDARVVVFEAEGGAACNDGALTPSWKCVLRAGADSWVGRVARLEGVGANCN